MPRDEQEIASVSTGALFDETDSTYFRATPEQTKAFRRLLHVAGAECFEIAPEQATAIQALLRGWPVALQDEADAKDGEAYQ